MAIIAPPPAGGGGSGMTFASSSVTTADVSAAAGTHYLLDVSGMTADRNFILPTPSAADEQIAVTLSAGDDTYELIIKGDTGVTINGGTAAAEWSRLFIDNETVQFVSTSTSNWQIVHDGRIPCIAVVHRSTNMTSSATNVRLAIEFDTEVTDRGACYDTTNYIFVPRRNGLYQGKLWWRSYGTASAFHMVGLQDITGATITTGVYTRLASLAASGVGTGLQYLDAAATIELTAGNEYAPTMSAATSVGVYADWSGMSLEEVLF